MAQDGWYINKILTDLQDGKVEEFVEKEGKKFNSIKADETSFTNAFDTGGDAISNMDPAEHTVQGIGFVSKAEVNPDSLGVVTPWPGLGGNVTVGVIGGSNWTSTGFSSFNILSMPSSGTFTIIPSAGYAISAASFSTLGFSLPSFVTSVNFSDNGLPGTASNTVTGTIVFDTSVSAPSSTNSYNGTIVLSFTAVPSLILWQGTIEINGIFLDNNIIQDQITNNSAYQAINIVTDTDVKKVWHVTKLINPNAPSQNIVDIDYTPGPNVIANPYVSQPYMTFDVQPGELSQYAAFINSSGGFGTSVNNYNGTNLSYNIVAEYDPNTSATVDDLNLITINLNSQLGNLYFDTALGNIASNRYPLPDNGSIGNSVGVPIYSSLGAFTVTATGDIANQITSIAPYYNGASSSVDLVVNPNTTGSNILGTLELTYNGNTTGTPNDILFVEQGLEDVVILSAALRASFFVLIGSGGSPANWTNLYTDQQPGSTTSAFGTSTQYNGRFFDLDGVGSNPIIPAEGTDVHLYAHYDQPAPYAYPAPSSLVINYQDPNNIGWITPLNFGAPTNSATVVNPAGPLVQYYGHAGNNHYRIEPQPIGGAARTAIITHAHYNDPTITDTLTITQEAGYDSSVNTLIFKDHVTVPTAPHNLGNTYEIDHNAQQITISAGIPIADLSEDNPFNIGGTQNITITANDPDPYYENPNFALSQAVLNQNTPAAGTIGSTTGDPWWYSINSNVGAPIGSSPGGSITHTVTLNVNNNFNVEASNPMFPVDRTFTLNGFNPENTSGNPDDTLQIVQKGQPAAQFFSNNSQLIVPASYSSNNNLTILAKANVAAPTCLSYSSQVPNASGVLQTILGSPAYLNSVTVTSTGNTNEYEVKFNLDENFSGAQRSFDLGLYHSTISNPATQDPSQQGLLADKLTVVQDPAILTLNANLLNATIPTGTQVYQLSGAVASQVGSLTFNSYAGMLLSSNMSFPSAFVIPLNFNGGTPVVLNVRYIDDTSATTTYTTGTPSWLAATPSISNNNLIFTVSNSASTTRSLKFNVASAQNNAAFISFEIQQQ
jgi:hypothetical protein